MLGLGAIRQSRSRRRYAAALTIIIAGYTYSLLTAIERQKVDEAVSKILTGTLGGASPFVFQRFYSASLKAACRAFAMAELHIPPAIPGESWNLPKKRWWMSPTPFDLLRNYRMSDNATTRAQVYLAARGVDLGALDL
jgi:hypothetical protein